MSKIEEFEAYDRFMKNIVPFILPVEQRLTIQCQMMHL